MFVGSVPPAPFTPFLHFELVLQVNRVFLGEKLFECVMEIELIKEGLLFNCSGSVRSWLWHCPVWVGLIWFGLVWSLCRVLLSSLSLKMRFLNAQHLLSLLYNHSRETGMETFSVPLQFRTVCSISLDTFSPFSLSLLFLPLRGLSFQY